MWPWYVCSYGELPVAGIAPYNCERNTVNINPAKNLGSDSNSCALYAGNPIHTRTGNKYAFESDFDSQSLNFTRHYNSAQNTLDRYIGIQWRHSYSSQLVFNQTTNSIPITFTERPDGKTIFFRFLD
jgi:hypothetical protein